MAQKIASLYVEIGGESSKLKSTLTDTKGKLGDFKKGLSDTIREATGLNLASVGLASGVGIVANELRKAVADTVAYAEQVRDLSRASGMGAEATSRLIQVADDAKVSYETLTLSLRTATQQGITLSTDALAKMSDQYLKLAPGVERNEFLIKNFGRAGLEMSKLMELGSKAIQDMTAAIDDNMVMTEEALRQTREYEKANDELADSFAGVKYQVGIPLVKALTDALNAGMLLLNWNKKLDKAFEEHKQTVIKQYGTYKEYKDEMLRTAKVMGWNITTLGGMEGAFKGNINTIQNLKEAIGLLTEEEYNLMKQNHETTAQGEFVSLTMYEIKESMQRAEGPIRDVAGAVRDVKGAFEDLIVVANANEVVLRVRMDYGAAFGNSPLTQAERNAAALRGEGSSPNNNYTPPPPANTTWIPSTVPTGAPGYLSGYNHAGGGMFTIPPGFNETWPLGGGHRASSGETVTVTPKGKSGQPVTINIIGAEKSPVEIAHEVARVIQRGR